MACENMNRWAGTYDLEKTQLYPLEKCCVYLFQTKDVIRHGVNEDFHGRAPLYHVWVDDKEVYCGPDMRCAYDLYRASLNESMVKSWL